jgi:hypothetical protein
MSKLQAVRLRSILKLNPVGRYSFSSSNPEDRANRSFGWFSGLKPKASESAGLAGQPIVPKRLILAPFKPALTLIALFLAFVLLAFSVHAQEHVDVPLPPYDPPPPASHHRETRDEQPPSVSRQTPSQPTVHARPHSQPETHHVKKSQNHHHPRRHARHRRHSFFHWPWQHRK